MHMYRRLDSRVNYGTRPIDPDELREAPINTPRVLAIVGDHTAARPIIGK